MLSSKKKNLLIDKPNHSVYSGIQLTSLFGHMTLLNLDLTNWSSSRSRHCPHRLPLYAHDASPHMHLSYPDVPIALEQAKLRLIIPHNVLQSTSFFLVGIRLHRCLVPMLRHYEFSHYMWLQDAFLFGMIVKRTRSSSCLTVVHKTES